jgi:Flp pilus assembly protein protease CpaA
MLSEIVRVIDSPIVRAILTGLIVLAGIQDLRTRRVSNWISIPLFFAGILFTALRVADAPIQPEVVGGLVVGGLMLIFYFAFHIGGEADVKIIVGLCGLWPVAGILGMAGGAVWGLVLLFWKGKGKEYPVMTASAVGVILTFFADVAKMRV